MRPRRRALLLSASAALHVAALGAMLAIAGSPGPVLFVDLASVDLVAGFENASSGSSPSAAAAGPAAPARDSRPVRRLERAAPPRVLALSPTPPMAAVTPGPSASPTFELSRETGPSDGTASAVPDRPVGPVPGTAAAAPRGGASPDAMGEGGRLGGASGGALLALAVPGDGPGAGVPAEYGPYLARFRQRIQEALVYPLAARRQGLSGTVEVEVLVEPSGLIRLVRLVSSSSHAVLDDAAVDTVKGLAPLALPQDLPRRPIRIRVPVVFRLR